MESTDPKVEDPVALELTCGNSRLRDGAIKYTPEEEARKSLALAEAAAAFPHVPALHREWCYDHIQFVGEEEFTRRVASGYYENNNGDK